MGSLFSAPEEYSCNTCNKKFTSKSDLSMHQRRCFQQQQRSYSHNLPSVQKSEKNVYPIYNQTSNLQYSNLYTHQHTQIPQFSRVSTPIVKPPKFPCNKCKKEFSDKSSLESHKEICNRTCTFCNLRYTKPKDLQLHFLLEHPSCLICELQKVKDHKTVHSRFESANQLLKHMEEKHSEYLMRPKLKRFFAQYKCYDCGSKWNSAYSWGTFIPFPNGFKFVDIDDYDSDFTAGQTRRLFRTTDDDGRWGEIFVYFPQQCRNCKGDILPIKCTYLQCSQCGEDIRDCECERMPSNYNSNKPHRVELCGLCKYLRQPCYKRNR